MAQRIDVRQRLGRRTAEPAAGPEPDEAATQPRRDRRPALPPSRRTCAVAAVLTAAALAVGLLWLPRPAPPPAPEFVAAAPLPLAAAPPPTAAEAASVSGAAASRLPARPLALLRAAGRPLPAERPAWLRNAVAIAATDGKPVIAIVIDDLGLDRRNAGRVVRLPGPLTLAFMTYADDLSAQARAARAAGHELLVHVPRQPAADALDPGINVLRPDLPAAELRRRIAWALSRFAGYVGVNNHMGSRFTADAAAMSVLFQELERRGLLFLDSRTTAASVAETMSVRYDVPVATRNIFLDNEVSAGAVQAQLARLEVEARRAGFAVAIGHPHDGTIAALQAWLPTLGERGFRLVPISAIAQRGRDRDDVAARRRPAHPAAAGRPVAAPMAGQANASSSAFAAFRSGVSKPSVNQP